MVPGTCVGAEMGAYMLLSSVLVLYYYANMHRKCNLQCAVHLLFLCSTLYLIFEPSHWFASSWKIPDGNQEDSLNGINKNTCLGQLKGNVFLAIPKILVAVEPEGTQVRYFCCLRGQTATEPRSTAPRVWQLHREYLSRNKDFSSSRYYDLLLVLTLDYISLGFWDSLYINLLMNI